jgi:microcystin degradation protein MlrC
VKSRKDLKKQHNLHAQIAQLHFAISFVHTDVEECNKKCKKI